MVHTRAIGGQSPTAPRSHSLFRIQFELPRHRDGRNPQTPRSFDEATSLSRSQPFSSAILNGVHWRHHYISVHAVTACATIRRSAPCQDSRNSFTRHDKRRRAVVRSWRIACVHRAVFLRGLHFPAFHRSIFARRFVIFNNQRLAFFLRHFNRQNLRLKKHDFRGSPLFMRSTEKRSCLRGDAVFFRDQFAGKPI